MEGADVTPTASFPSAWPGLLDELLDATGTGVAVIDRALRCVWANATLDQLLGHPVGWSLGRVAQDLLGGQWPSLDEALWHSFTAPAGTLRTRLGVAPTGRGRPGPSTTPSLALETRPWRDPDDPTGSVAAVILVVRPRASLAEVGRAWGDAERRYRLLAEQTTEVVTILGGDGTIRYISPSVRSVLGYDPDELVGRRRLPVVDEDERRGLVTEHTHAAVGTPVLSLVRVRRAEGRVVWLENTTRRLEGDDGTGASYHVSSRDVTARVRAQTLMDVSAAIDRVLLERPDVDDCLGVACDGLAELVDCAATAVWVLDADGRLGVAAAAGPRADALRRADASEPDHPAARAARGGDDQLVEDLADAGGAWPAVAEEARLGAGLWVPITDAGTGAVVGVLGFVTHRGEPVDRETAQRLATIAQRLAVARRLEADRAALEDQRAALAEANAHLEQRVAERTADLDAALAELESFSYSVSHDLRAPLRTIGTYVEMIAADQHERLDVQGRSDLAVVGSTISRLAEMVDALLQLARVTGSELDRIPVDLVAQACEIGAELQRAQPDHRVRLRAEGTAEVVADPRLTRVLLTNLLANAWKFTGGTPEPVVTFSQEPGTPTPTFCVADNGVGFEPSQAHRLFIAFQRLHPSEAFPGSGVGLATVARVCRRHGGRVWAEGAPGEGARFCFTLTPDDPGTAR